MAKIVVSAKALQAVRQAAKDLHTRNATAYISKGELVFEIVGDSGKKIIKLEDVENDKH